MKSEKQKVILIIEASVELREFGRDMLSSDFQVVHASNGVDGVNLARKINPEIILCDVEVPLLSGLAVCARLKSDLTTSHISIILLQASPSEFLETECLRAGADDYILRAFDSKILALKIENQISLRTALRAQSLLPTSYLQQTQSLDGGFLEKVHSLVSENISDPNFGVHQMAFQIGVSVSVLYRKIRVLTGNTVNDFVKMVRMKRALQLLEAGTYHVNEVANAVGYEDSKYFSREFRKTFGKTPTEIKRR